MLYKFFMPIITCFIALFLFSCGVPVGSRYTQKTEKTSTPKPSPKEVANKYPENFNLAKYRSKINVKEEKKDTTYSDLEPWYNYSVQPNRADTSKTAIKNVPGYRVQVATTDNLDEANQLRSEIYFKTKQRAIYVIFDPPFYKVEIGDFIDINDAKNLSFKLKQMGYSNARVINETINIFE